jgi:hypothetical protein
MAIIKIRNAAIDLDAAEIPNLPASKITSGTLDNARISLDAAEIPNLDTAKITSGTLADARIPANALNSNVDLTNLSATNMTSGTLPDARFPATLPAVSGASLTNLPASGTTVLLHSNVLSSSSGNAGVNINGFFTTDYKIYKLYVYNFSLTGGVGASVQLISGGSRQNSNYRFINNASKNEYSTISNVSYGGWGSSEINISPSSGSGQDWGGGQDGRSFLEVTFYDPLNTSYYKTVDMNVGNNSNNNQVWSGRIFAEWRDTSAVTGIGIFGNSNTAIYSGTEFKLFGIKT